ncbi:hypothetical protein P3T40_008078 [Paraburkholderia sp. EB58]
MHNVAYKIAAVAALRLVIRRHRLGANQPGCGAPTPRSGQ